ncbi:pectinesterase family protein [Geofilum sp. OHC36d9]|uniref:pectinesterase family protein n=1 Tax=Geofilum sp. OHC36d9 TaxID=3458413 RepID=UPI0040336344
MKKNLYLFYLLGLLLIPFSGFSQVKLAEWNFDYEYTTSISNDSTFYVPAATALLADPDITVPAKSGIYPEEFVGLQTKYLLTTSTTYSQLKEGYSNYVCRMMFQGPNNVSDFTNPINHSNYYQFTFPTKGYEDITLDFSLSSGQNSTDDYLEAVYSTDGGTTWVDAGNFNAASGWWVYNSYSVSISAKNKEKVMVRLIGITASTSATANFNVDYFKVNGVVSLAGLVVDATPTIAWAFDLGTEGQIATYSDLTSDYFKPDHVTLGSNLAYVGSRLSDGVTFTQFQPTVQSSEVIAMNAVSFNIWTKTGLSFTPTSVEFDCERFGTNGGMIDVIWKASDGTTTTIGTGIKPNRNGDGVTHALLDLSELSIPASGGECTLAFYITELGNTKQVGIANIQLIGDLTGTILDIPTYTVNATVSPEGAGVITSLPVGNEFDENTEVTLTTTRNFGYEFSKWIDENSVTLSENEAYTFTLDGNKSVVAVYNEITTYGLDLTVAGSQWGEIALSPEPTDGKYEVGTIVSASVVSNPVTSFLYWDDNSTETIKNIVMDGNKSITATFDEIPFIVGWDFRNLDPKVSRPGDFYSETTNTGSLSVYKTDGTTVGWLAHTAEYSPAYPNARIWAVDFTNDRRYFMASFSTENFINIRVHSKMIGSYQIYPLQKLEYSLDGTNFTTLTTVDLTDGYKSVWTDVNAVLPTEAEGQAKVYIRWIADETSTPIGEGNDGTAITNIFVFADKVVVNDTEKPSLLSTVPASASTNASANGSITLTFNEKVMAGTGNCTLEDDVLTAVFGAKTATFKYEKLEYDKEYTFIVPAGAISDQSGNPFDGTTITFKTMERPQPTARLFDAVIALDGSGDYTTLQDAIDAAPSGRAIPWLIFIKEGTYTGHVDIPESKPFIHLIGQSSDKVIVSDDRLAGEDGDPDTPTYHVSLAATVVVNAMNCYFENITFQNSYGYENQTGPQALAMYTNNDKITFKNCTLRSYQDTYLTSTKLMYDRHYLVDCRIEGAVDYIYGAGDVFFDACTIYNTRPSGGYIVAPNHPAGTLWGYVFNHCIIDGNPGVITYYGRPWHNSPKTVFLYPVLKCDVYSGGWYYKMGAIPAIFADYGSMDEDGNLVDLSNRISEYEYDEKDDSGNVINTVTGIAKNSLTDEEAATYTYENILLRSGDTWDPKILTEPTMAPEGLVLNGNILSWNATPYAMCYVVLRNNEVIGFTTENTFTDNEMQQDGEYTYSIKAASEYGALSLSSQEVSNYVTAVNKEGLDAQIKIIGQSGSILISGITKTSFIRIYNLTGGMVKHVTCNQPSIELPLTKGIYLVTVSADRMLKSGKVLVK